MGKSLTLHGLDDQLAAEIKRRAQEAKISMNELAKRVLAEGLGIKRPAKPPHYEEFAQFCGDWTDDEADEFDRIVAEGRRIDPKDWQ